jgi:prepilin-type N-terminal cleavage/methylation domain-containing protein
MYFAEMRPDAVRVELKSTIHRADERIGNMKTDTTIPIGRKAQAGFTLIEVAFASAIAAILLAGMFQGYNVVGQQAQFSAFNLAASASAMRQLEQIEAANWVPSYGENTLLTLGSTTTGNLCLPSANGNVATCTNVATVTQISANPPYAQIQVQCIWLFPLNGVTYTNTVAVLRAPNE